MKSKTLSKKERNEIDEAVYSAYDVTIIRDSDVVRQVEYNDSHIITCDGNPVFYTAGEEYIPLLVHLLREDDVFLKKIRIDMGGVKPISGGADIMIPGIVDIDDVEEDDVVAVVDETHGKPLSIARMNMDADKVGEKSKGVAAESIHNIGDDLWEFTKKL